MPSFSFIHRKEINQIMNSSYLRGLNMASFFAASKVIVFVTFTVYVLLGNPISASRVFVTVSLYGTIKVTVTLFCPLAVEKLSESIVSFRRINVMFGFHFKHVCVMTGSFSDATLRIRRFSRKSSQNLEGKIK